MGELSKKCKYNPIRTNEVGLSMANTHLKWLFFGVLEKGNIVCMMNCDSLPWTMTFFRVELRFPSRYLKNMHIGGCGAPLAMLGQNEHTINRFTSFQLCYTIEKYSLCFLVEALASHAK